MTNFVDVSIQCHAHVLRTIDDHFAIMLTSIAVDDTIPDAQRALMRETLTAMHLAERAYVDKMHEEITMRGSCCPSNDREMFLYVALGIARCNEAATRQLREAMKSRAEMAQFNSTSNTDEHNTQ